MRIEVTAFAITQLKDIRSYYANTVSERVANQILDKLFTAIESLERLPSIGSIEENLKEMGKKHRYLVCGNYKIIFYKDGKTIYITDVFDARQNPKKISGRNS